MSNRTIQITPSIYVLEVTTHSNNKKVISFCWNCLGKSKTNHEYIAYDNFPTISSQRICAKCGAMTITAVIAAFDLSIAKIIHMVELGHTIWDVLPNENVLFTCEPVYLNILKGQLNHGKIRRSTHKSGR